MRQKEKNKIRSSNYIFTYGPGSVYELPDNKTVMILGTDFWTDPEKTENKYKQVIDERLSSILEKENFYEPPDNRIDSSNDGKTIPIPAAIFPDWQVCKTCNSLFRYSEYKEILELFRSQALNKKKEFNIRKADNKRVYKDIPHLFCPQCTKKKDINSMTRDSFIKFRFPEVYSFSYVVICNNGHIENPDMHKLFSISPNSEEKIKFEYRSKGLELSEQEIWATVGNRRPLKKTIADLYHMYSSKSKDDILCSGKRYWLKNSRNENCLCSTKSGNIRLVKKGDSLVYFPQMISSLSIPPFIDKDEVKQKENIKNAIQVSQQEASNEYSNSKEKATQIEPSSPKYQFYVNKASRYINSQYCEEVKNLSLIEHYVRLDFKNQIKDIGSFNTQSITIPTDITEINFRKEEYKILVQTIHNEKLDPPFDSTVYKHPKKLPYLMGLTKIEDVSITHVVTGFTRVYPPYERKGTLQKIGPQKMSWLPAIQVRGEGIFLDFDAKTLSKWKGINQKFLDERMHEHPNIVDKLEKYQFLFDIDKDNFHYFYLLHSFSHYLINILSFFSGFNAASIRERIYFQKPYDLDNEIVSDPIRGILLTTSSGGTEASLGGLSRYGNENLLGDLIEKTIDKLKICSNDPICAEGSPHGENLNFSSCFGCLYLPETSCELHNNFLDRQLLIGEGDGIDKPIGFLNVTAPQTPPIKMTG